MSFSENFLSLFAEICERIDHSIIDRMAMKLAKLRQNNGRLFILGVGGSAGNASHDVNDFRKLCDIETYSPTDNVSELTARINDDGWESSFSEWLIGCRVSKQDGVLVLSVGGGNLEKNVSMNIVTALNLAKERNLSIFGIVGRDGGHVAKLADEVVIIPTIDKQLITPYAESFQAVIWHCLVSHPELKLNPTKW